MRATSRWLVKRILPSLAKRKRMRISASPLPDPHGCMLLRPGVRNGAGRHRREKSYRYLTPGREILAGTLAPACRRHRRGHHVFDPETGARPAVVAGGPPTVLQTVVGQCIEPVLPQEVAVQAGREVVPGQHLALGPVPVDAVLEGQLVRSQGIRPQQQIEVLGPFLEGPAVAPHLLDA